MTKDAVVDEVVDFLGVRYAVIAGLRTETGPERLVIAYPENYSAISSLDPPLSRSASPRARRRLQVAELPCRPLSLTSECWKQ
jgi:hypothetical protein